MMVVPICIMFQAINRIIEVIQFILDDIMKLFHLPDQEQEAVFALGHYERRGRGGGGEKGMRRTGEGRGLYVRDRSQRRMRDSRSHGSSVMEYFDAFT